MDLVSFGVYSNVVVGDEMLFVFKQIHDVRWFVVHDCVFPNTANDSDFGGDVA